jgi:type IV pilus assembly protein PilX
MKTPVHKLRHPVHRRQHGVVLIVALVLLLVLSILGISSMQGTVMQERMAGNTFDRALAFQAAEAALRAGEQAAQTPANIEYDVETNPAPAPEQLAFDDAQWDGAAADELDFNDLPANPRYMIERLRAFPPLEADQPMEPALLQVTARGTGRYANSDGDTTTVVVLQSIYKP